MCGIVGVAGFLLKDHGKMFRDMWIADILRGMDSAGVVDVGLHKNSVKTEKELGTPLDVFAYGGSEIFNFKGLPKRFGRALIGHNRAATLGKVKAANAHPFNFGSIYGVHNGTLRDWKDLEGYDEFDVDSKALYKTIAEKGIDHAWKSFLGAAALVWWDDSDGTLNMIRNSERPLHIAYANNGKVILWASEKRMLQFAAAGVSGFKFDERKDDEGKLLDPIFQLAADHFHKWKVTTSSPKLLEVRELEKKKFTPVQSNTGGNGVIGTTHGNFGTNYNQTPGFKPFVPMGATINENGWAEGLRKAGKEWRGVEVYFQSAVNKVLSTKGGNSRIIRYILKFEDDYGNQYEVYPSNMKDFTNFEKMMPNLKYTKYIYRTKHRPRIRVDNGKLIYLLSFAGIEPVKSVIGGREVLDEPDLDMDGDEYPGPYGTPVTRQELVELLEQCEPKCSCSWCSSPIQEQDYKDIGWIYSKSVLCADCTSNPHVAGMMASSYH